MKVTISTATMGLSGLLAAVGVGQGVAAYMAATSSSEVMEHYKAVLVPGLAAAADLESHAAEIHSTSGRLALDSASETVLAELAQATSLAEAELAKLRAIVNEPTMVSVMDTLETDWAAFASATQQVSAFASSGDRQAAAALWSGALREAAEGPGRRQCARRPAAGRGAGHRRRGGHRLLDQQDARDAGRAGHPRRRRFRRLLLPQPGAWPLEPVPRAPGRLRPAPHRRERAGARSLG